MSPWWVLPLVVLALGALPVAVATRRLVAEVRALRPAVDDLGAVAVEARALRADTAVATARGSELLDVGARVRAFRQPPPR